MKLIPIDVLVCIVNWNTANLTSQLIESIYNTVKRLCIEIFVADNASTDGSVQNIVTHYPEATIIKNDHNIGYGPSMNQALRISSGKHKMILNSDVILLDDELENMVTFLENNQAAGAFGPISLAKGGNILYPFRIFPSPAFMILERVLGSLMSKIVNVPPLEEKPEMNNGEELEVSYIKGPCMLVRSKVCDEIGLFDEDFFGYYEETDWCFKMMKRGVKRYLIPSAKNISYSRRKF